MTLLTQFVLPEIAPSVFLGRKELLKKSFCGRESVIPKMELLPKKEWTVLMMKYPRPAQGGPAAIPNSSS